MLEFLSKVLACAPQGFVGRSAQFDVADSSNFWFACRGNVTMFTTPSSASVRLAAYSQVGGPGLRYKPINSRLEKIPLPPSW